MMTNADLFAVRLNIVAARTEDALHDLAPLPVWPLITDAQRQRLDMAEKALRRAQTMLSRALADIQRNKTVNTQQVAA